MSVLKPYLMAFCLSTATFFGIGAMTAQTIPIKQDFTKSYVKHKPKAHKRTVKELQKAYDATVAVLHGDGTNMRTIGSGVILQHEKGKPIKVLTAFHVVRELYPGVIYFSDLGTDTVHMAAVTASDIKHDLAVLTTVYDAAESGESVTLASEEPELGSVGWVIGNPRGVQGNISVGIVSNILTTNDGTRYYRLDAAIYYGNSGGGIFNKKGDLIGIAHAIEIKPNMFAPQIIPGGGLAISLSTIQAFLK